MMKSEDEEKTPLLGSSNAHINDEHEATGSSDEPRYV